MDELVDKVLRKTKKPISMEKIYEKVENLLKKENEDFYQLDEESKIKINSIVSKGVDDYKYIKTPVDTYISIMKTSYRIGRFYGNRNGEGKVIVTTSFINGEGEHKVLEDTYIINKDSVNKAIDGDIVLIDTATKDKSKRLTAKVSEIIDRQIENIVGEVVRIGNGCFLKPIDKRFNNLTIALDDLAIEGQRVLISLDDQVSDNFYIGKIIQTFNHKDDPDSDILWEAFKCGIIDKFSSESMEMVKDIPQKVLDSDKIDRMDLTDWEIFTIDGEDTKDIDDALSCKILDNGNYLVGVHIADVSHYVKEGSPLDLDAFKRGTSAYLAGKVIPMLPHELSNGICSLNPNVERLALSCIMEVNSNGEVINYNIYKSIIKSNLKMSYTKVNDILKNNILDDDYVKHADTIRNLNKLALVLRKKRICEGAIEFDKPELKINLDTDGNVVGVSVRKQDLGENLIEEFMLLANETVDKHLCNNGWPCLHRVHDVPSNERLSEFLNLLDIIGFRFNNYKSMDYCTNPKYLQELADYIKETGSHSDMLSTNLVRCMSRAKYSPINIGHSGLAKTNYCHFTSPIRRYPDLVIHRIVKDSLFDQENIRDNKRKWKDSLSDIARNSSKMERAADDAEMQTLYMKCAEYMSKHIGQDYSGTIIGISNHGIQIQLDNYIEGKIRLRNLPGDYSYNPNTFSLVSLSGLDDYYIGDRLNVKVVGADPIQKTIDFKVNEKIEEHKNEKISNSNNLVKNKVLEEKKYKKNYGIY